MILKFLQFINEELTKIPFYKSKSGSSSGVHLIYDDENPYIKSQASGILLRNKLKEDEIESIVSLLGTENIPKHYINDPKFFKLLVVYNNLKFLKDTLEDKGRLECEYCGKGPLVIYDIVKNSDNARSFLDNPKYKLNVKFNPVDGATCDHKVPQSKGGDKFDYNNLAVCCYSCNQGKGNMDYEDWLERIKNLKDNK